MRVNEQGRSMIEMLGVLAIVGVLSVGGIAGYSKAMNKFKTNKVIDQINMISTNIRTLYSSQRDFEGLNNQVAKSAGIVSGDMYSGAADSNSDITNAFQGEVYITTGYHNGKANAAYIIGFNGLPKSACVAAATTDWGGDVGSGFAAMLAHGSDEDVVTAKEAADALVGAADANTPAGETDGAVTAVPGNTEGYGTPMSIGKANIACASDSDNAMALKYI